ncbi:GNAT family N-acetyltransferase [Anaerotignum sp.]|uniref:GNAT family N-acetyltransferase n=1 Tax=Anaerotignum sp. TaxID=2039241 RepID=UPI0037353AA9
MELRQITTGKTDFMDLLLLGDEQEDMVMKYLERGEMAVLFDGEDAIALSVVTKEGEDLWELKNIAVLSSLQGKGYGKKLVRFWQEKLRGKGVLQVGTGETPKTMGFYTACGFQFSHRITDFFVHHYDHPIVEDGILLKDMVYFSYKL